MVQLSVSFQGQSITLHRVGASVTVRWSMNFIDPISHILSYHHFLLYLSFDAHSRDMERQREQARTVHPFWRKKFFLSQRKTEKQPWSNWPMGTQFKTVCLWICSLVSCCSQVIDTSCRRSSCQFWLQISVCHPSRCVKDSFDCYDTRKRVKCRLPSGKDDKNNHRQVNDTHDTTRVFSGKLHRQ